jgi:choline dehydrogenase-like flavoprotein
MILDHLDATCPRELKADICIVGAGAAGLALAMEFVNSDLEVVVLESGGWESEARTQALYDTEQTGMPFQSAHTGRFRILGGTTTRWGGQSLPLTPLDFERREWVNHSGWPISYDGLLSYYDRANRFLGVDTRDYRDETAKHLRLNRPLLDPATLDYHFSKWAPQPNLRQTYRRALERSGNVRVVLHANVTELEVDGPRVRIVHYCSLGRQIGTIKAAYFILATGGLEIPRLLLSSRRQVPTGLGNECDQVGRFLQEHPATLLGEVEVTDAHKLQQLFNGRRAEGRRFSARLSLSRAIQEKKGLLNASAGFLFSLPTDQGFGLLRAAVKRQSSAIRDLTYGRILSESVRCLPELITAAWMLGIEGRIFTPGASCEVAASFEQEPNPSSRVILSEKYDELGMPLANIHWRLTRKTYETAVQFASVIDHTLRTLQVGRLKRSDWLLQDDGVSDYEQFFHDQNHHIGTARISVSPQDGVVDSDLKVHSLLNLYIASSATFPTGGHSNPTLTMLALTIRLADHLRRKYQQYC